MTAHNDADCWWCGAAADSREHKFKRRDLDRGIGRGSWHGRLAAHRRPGDDDFSYPNSSRSDSLKFRAVLCGNCNSHRSQPIDRDYDRFADFVRAEGATLYASGRLDWSESYGSRWELGRDNVIRYWVKHVGCRLAELSLPIPTEWIAFLNGDGPLLHLKMELEIRETFADLQRDSLREHGEPMRGLWIGELRGWGEQKTGRFLGAEGHWGLDALFLVYSYTVDESEAASNFAERVNQLPRVRGLL